MQRGHVAESDFVLVYVCGDAWFNLILAQIITFTLAQSSVFENEGLCNVVLITKSQITRVILAPFEK